MQLTIFTDYGLRTLMYLASNPDRLCSVKEIAEHYTISRNHLVKVAHYLGQHGYVTSIKGKGGGLRLARDPADLKLGDLIRHLEPNMNLVECFNAETNTCRITKACTLKHYLMDANKAFLASLNAHTLADTILSKQQLIQLPPLAKT